MRPFRSLFAQNIKACVIGNTIFFTPNLIKNLTRIHEETASVYGRLENRYRFGMHDSLECSEDKWHANIFKNKTPKFRLSKNGREVLSYPAHGLDYGSYVWTKRHLGRNHFLKNDEKIVEENIISKVLLYFRSKRVLHYKEGIFKRCDKRININGDTWLTFYILIYIILNSVKLIFLNILYY